MLFFWMNLKAMLFVRYDITFFMNISILLLLLCTHMSAPLGFREDAETTA